MYSIYTPSTKHGSWRREQDIICTRYVPEVQGGGAHTQARDMVIFVLLHALFIRRLCSDTVRLRTVRRYDRHDYRLSSHFGPCFTKN